MRQIKAFPITAGCQARQRPSRPPAAPLRGCCASLDRRRRPRPRNRVGAGNVQGKRAAAGVEQETGQGYAGPARPAKLDCRSWEPAGCSCFPVGGWPAFLLSSPTAPDFPESHGCFRSTLLLSRFLFDPPEAPGRKSGALSAPTPSSRHGAQGRSGMPKAPRSGGSRRRSVLDGPEHRGSYPQIEIIHCLKFKFS